MSNPYTVPPSDLTDEQRRAGFRAHFVNTASFDFAFGTDSGNGCCQVRRVKSIAKSTCELA